MSEQKKIGLAFVFTGEEMCKIIEDEIARLGRDITNEEMQQLLGDAAIKQHRVIGMTEHPEAVDVDLMVGNLREEGAKVKFLNEEWRREDKEKQ